MRFGSALTHRKEVIANKKKKQMWLLGWGRRIDAADNLSRGITDEEQLRRWRTRRRPPALDDQQADQLRRSQAAPGGPKADSGKASGRPQEAWGKPGRHAPVRFRIYSRLPPDCQPLQRVSPGIGPWVPGPRPDLLRG